MATPVIILPVISMITILGEVQPGITDCIMVETGQG